MAESQVSDPSQVALGQTAKNNTEFIILPLGININDKNALPSVLIRGYEDGLEAVNFENWLISFDDVVQALQLDVTTLDDGQLEIRSPGLIKRIDTKQLQLDPEIGLAISVKQIRTILGVTTEFDIAEYAVVFAPPWAGVGAKGSKVSSRFLPVITEGLPLIEAPVFSLSALGQEINFTNTKDGESDKTTNKTQGKITALGTLFGNSWYVSLKQTDLTELTNKQTWEIDEIQLLRQKDSADYVLGMHPTFWENQSDGDYWGLTTIQRWGFTLPSAPRGGFNAAQRLQTNEIGLEIVGEAEPGTLVQLRQDFSEELFGEVLVDSSGVYRFENIKTQQARNSSFKVFLYPNGQLTAEPEIRDADFSTIPGQLIKGGSALIASVGANREDNELFGNFGDFTNFQGGLSYRRGMTEDLTLGAGVVYDKSLLGMGEIFYQPSELPLTLTASALMGTAKNGLEFDADLRFEPSQNLSFNLRADEISQRANLNWRVSPNISLRTGANLGEGSFTTGVSFSQSNRKFSNFASVDFDSNDNNLRWNLRSRLNSLELSHRGDKDNLNTTLKYRLSSAHSLSLNYNTRLSGDEANNLAVVNWSYRPKAKNNSGRKKLQLDLGYGIGSQGQGLIASATTSILPGLDLRASYRQISGSSSDNIFRLQISPSLFVQPKLGLGDNRLENLRGQGGLLIQPFLDSNGNGKLDAKEEIYTEDINYLLVLNNRPLRQSQGDIRSNGVLFPVNPGKHRIDLDPAGYPLDYSPLKTAYAAKVAAGSYTVVQIPFAVSYTIAGTVTDAADKPMGGATIEAIATGDIKKKVISVTNGSGIFYLEGLQRGNYELFINGKPARLSAITIDESTEPFSEINLQPLQ